jgi:hypothetical protein
MIDAVCPTDAGAPSGRCCAPWRWPGPEYRSAGHFLRHFQQPASECESDAR